VSSAASHTGPDGVLVIDKPAGMTSHDVVDGVRRSLKTKKVGHAGTLDPDATGVLIVGVGRATRFLSYAQAAPKRYTAVARFGVTTATQDASGEVVERRPAPLTEGEVAAALPAFRGPIRQTPPMVSAVKIGGERLYAKARRGEEVERSERAVTVFRLDLVGYTAGEEPEATLDVICSAGTYVRTLVHDIGASLGCGAHLRSLRRIEAGGFSCDDAIPLERAGAAALRPLTDAVRWLPRIELRASERAVAAHGGALAVRPEAAPAEASPGTSWDETPASVRELRDGEAVALLADGALLGVYVRRGQKLVADRVVSR
jgi:tRNA pseudouridine55 synthase